eukprot:1714065-Prymnesium_polylepis.1
MSNPATTQDNLRHNAYFIIGGDDERPRTQNPLRTPRPPARITHYSTRADVHSTRRPQRHRTPS